MKYHEYLEVITDKNYPFARKNHYPEIFEHCGREFIIEELRWSDTVGYIVSYRGNVILADTDYCSIKLKLARYVIETSDPIYEEMYYNSGTPSVVKGFM